MLFMGCDQHLAFYTLGAKRVLVHDWVNNPQWLWSQIRCYAAVVKKKVLVISNRLKIPLQDNLFKCLSQPAQVLLAILGPVARKPRHPLKQACRITDHQDHWDQRWAPIKVWKEMFHAMDIVLKCDNFLRFTRVVTGHCTFVPYLPIDIISACTLSIHVHKAGHSLI